MTDPDIDATMKEIISRYLILGDVEAFVQEVSIRHKEISGLRSWQ